METCASSDAPMTKGDKLSKNKNSKNGGKMSDMESKPYARLIGSLMFQYNPSHEHWVAGKKVLRYLQKTKSHMLVYRQVKKLELVGYNDSDFAGHYPDSKKSTSSYVFMLVGGAVAWKTMKQSLISTSTMQAEFIAIYEGVCEGLWIKNFLMHTKILSSIVSDALKIFCDNEAVVFFGKNSKRSNNSKHIDLKFYSVRERVKHCEINVLNINTESQLADPFTKALSVTSFQKHTKNMGILPDLEA
ncbi:secreted RxLR effector protein 161-like [Rosa chinensis]|uniref:secreted RxLR effector protein 161-like n=1 Tax=Rosa chinensis TaxID=74649 RepID=UPI001AD92864|nr:secreted RxLR effector protein 161-like [Rosa chinensis]